MDKIYDFQNQEPKWQEFWHKEEIFKFNPLKKGKVFSIDTPPPTISGKMHLGHAFSYTHQDIIARYHKMKGENVFYPFGTDDNGLPTEKLVEKINNIKLFDLKRSDFIDLCQKTIKQLLPEFISDWKKIGMSCDFSRPYSTINPEVQKITQKYFIELYNAGRIYQKESPVLWCPECSTAIAQAETQDNGKESLFVEIEFKIKDTRNEAIVIATTRPELLASCVAIFVHPKDKKYKKMIGKTAITPIFNQEIPILKDKEVDMEKGTGAVMCSTFGDTQDMEWYFNHKLPLRISIDQNGNMNNVARGFTGIFVKKARKMILQELEKLNLVKNQIKINHTINTHERCGTPIEILVTKQWFIKYLDLKDSFLEQSQKINWNPKYMKARLDNWILGLRFDWCISRQRYFGVPIPVWYCEKCKDKILPEISDLPIDPLNSEPKKQCKCGGTKFIPEKDVLDTWATSSLTPQIAYSSYGFKPHSDKINGLGPMNLRPQGHDIINFWLFYTLARSYLHFKELPWKDVMISGFVLDPKGEKMSKSKGNVIDPNQVIEKYGADALRYWAAQSALGDDLRYSEEEIKIGKKTVNKIWNASNFSLMHLKDYVLSFDNAGHLEDEDKWILTNLYIAIKEYTKAMDDYKYAKAKSVIDNLFWKNFCDYYLEIIKNRLYEPKGEENKKAAQFTLYTLILAILKMYAPIIPHITEEVYQLYFKEKEGQKSIHLCLLPDPKNIPAFTGVRDGFELAIEAIDNVRKIKTEKKLSMKAELDIAVIVSKDQKKAKKYLPLVSELLNIKKIEIS